MVEESKRAAAPSEAEAKESIKQHFGDKRFTELVKMLNGFPKDEQKLEVLEK